MVLVHLPHGRTAAAVRDALIDVFTDLPPALRRSLTWDQGKEFSAHADLIRAVGMPVFFWQPHSPLGARQQREHCLLRDYFPKGSDLAVHPADRLAEVAAELSERPRKTLGWASPAGLLAPHLEPQQLRLTSPSNTVVLQR